MNIRHANSGDAAAIAETEARSYPRAEAASLGGIEKRLAAFPNNFWLLEDGGALIGFINGMATDEADLTDEMYDNAEMHRENGRWQMIFSVVTAPEFRNRGFAATIMERVIEDTKAAGRLGIVLTCKQRLIPFYSKFGFVNEGVSASVHGGAVWYQMRLKF